MKGKDQGRRIKNGKDCLSRMYSFSLILGASIRNEAGRRQGRY
jgi:hypothetical protein